MKLYVALIHAFLISALSYSSLANHCSPTQGQERRNLHDVLVDSLDKCFRKIGNIDLQTLADIDLPSDSKTVIGNFCQKQDLIRDCLSVSSAQCDETQRDGYKLVEDVLKTALSYSCARDGKYFEVVSFLVFLEENSTSERNALTNCFATAKSTGVESDNVDTSARLLGFYREFKVFKRCILDRLHGSNREVFGAELMLNGMQRSMKCPHPEDTTTVLCETLDVAPLTEEKVCPYAGVEKDDHPNLPTVINFAAECILVNLNQPSFDKVRHYRNIEDIRSFYSTYCRNRHHVLNCLSDISSNSKVCQNETDHKILELFNYVMEFSLETGCKQDGANVATIVGGILNLGVPVMGNDTIRDCIRASEKVYKSGSNPNDTASTRTVLVYRSVDSLKKCVLDASSEAGTYKTVLATFMNEILRAAKCLAEDGTAVLCETLLNN